MNSTGAILVVEDDDSVRSFVRTVLQRHGFATLSAVDGNDGLKTFLESRKIIRFVLSDVVMPDCSGPEMVARILQFEPSCRIAFMSGTASTFGLPPDVRTLPVLKKPFTAYHLLRFVNECLDL